jgi:hypothetical protein
MGSDHGLMADESGSRMSAGGASGFQAFNGEPENVFICP